MTMLYNVFELISNVLVTIGVGIVLYGALFAVYHLAFEIIGQAHHAKGLNVDHIRLEFGRNIVLALEFIVAADIIATITAPDYYAIGILAILVIIRVVLSYFLSKELLALTPPERSKLR